jgi:hypothetical protein
LEKKFDIADIIAKTEEGHGRSQPCKRVASRLTAGEEERRGQVAQGCLFENRPLFNSGGTYPYQSDHETFRVQVKHMPSPDSPCSNGGTNGYRREIKDKLSSKNVFERI